VPGQRACQVIVPAFENLEKEQKLVKDVKTLTRFDVNTIREKKYLWNPLAKAFRYVGLKLSQKTTMKIVKCRFYLLK
jgi:hypothetical protein